MLNLMPTVSFASDSEKSTRVKWQGYDTSKLDASVWDGVTYDTSWYTGDGGRGVHAGTEDDPYLIEDADDLAGLSKLTNSPDNVELEKIDYIPVKQSDRLTTFFLRDVRLSETDVNAYWFFDNITDMCNIEYSVAGDIVERDDGREGYQINNFKVEVKVGEKVIDITDVIVAQDLLYDQLYYAILPYDEFINRFGEDANTYASRDQYITFMNALPRQMGNKLQWGIDTEKGIVQLCLKEDKSVIQEYTLEEVGLLDWGGYTLRTAKGDVKVWDSTTDNLDDYELLCDLRNSRTVSAYKFKDSVKGFIINDRDDVYAHKYTETVSDITYGSYSDTSKIRTITYDTDYKYFYFYDKTLSSSFDENDDALCYAYSNVAESRYKSYTFSIYYNTRNRNSQLRVSGTGDAGSKTFTIPNLSASGTGTWYISDIDYTFDILTTGVVEITIKSITSKDGQVTDFNGTPLVYTSNKMPGVTEDFTNAKVYAMDGTELGVFDADRYEFITKSNKSAEEILKAVQTYRKQKQVICDTAANAAFKGKYFKITKNIDMNCKLFSLFPDKNIVGYGMSANVDLNGNILYNLPPEFIGTINEDGVIRNGTLVQGVVERNGYSYKGALINENRGKVEDIEYMGCYDFDKTLTYNNSVLGILLVQINFGEVGNCRIISSWNHGATLTGIQYESGIIKNIKYLIINCFNDYNTSAYYSLGVLVWNMNYGIVEDCDIDADEDVIGENSRVVRFNNIVGGNVSKKGPGIVKNLYVHDFSINAIAFAPFGVSCDAYDCESYVKGISTDTSNIFGYTLGNGNLYNCIIHSTAPNMNFDINNSAIQIIENCDIYLGGNVGRYHSGLFMDGVRSMKNTKFIIDIYKKVWDLRIFNRGAVIENCDIQFLAEKHGEVEGYTDTYCSFGEFFVASEVKDSTIYIDRTYQYSYGLFKVHNFINTDIKIDKMIGLGAVLTGSDASIVRDCNVSVDYIAGSTVEGLYPGYRMFNTNYFVTFEKDCAYKADNNAQVNFQPLTFGTLENCLISIVNKSDNLYVPKSIISSYAAQQGSNPYYGDLKAVINGLTLLIDGVNISDEMPAIFGYGRNQSNMSQYSNIYVDAKNIGIDEATTDTLYGFGQLYTVEYPVMNNIVMNVELKNTNNAFVGFSRPYPSGNFMALSDIAVKCNTKNPKSILIREFMPKMSSLSSGSFTELLQNVYWDVDDAQNNDLVPSANASGYVPGLFGVTDASVDAKDTYNMQKAGGVVVDYYAISNVIVPNNNSVIAQYYNADESTTDSWNIDKHLNEIAYSFSEDLDAEEGLIVNKLNPEWVSYVDADVAEIDGTLAYKLDKGSSQYRRSKNWTVIEEPIDIYNTITGEKVATIPIGTVNTTMYIPEEATKADNINLNAIYKVEIKDTENGKVEASGLNNVSSDNGEMYVKEGTNLKTVETVDNENIIFTYALQSFYGGTASRIPSTHNDAAISTYSLNNTSDYTIDGYKVNAADTVITPVFKTARHITVNIENDEHGTIVPSEWVSASGETVKLSMVVDDGYIINDIKINGEALTGMSFIMPDADVEITGTVVPFEGGITRFAVFGFEGAIDQINHTINVEVPRMGNIANAVADIEYIGNYITPSIDSRVDFTNPVVYTVNYGDNKTVEYVVTVTQSEYTMRIYDFVLNGVHGTINQATRVINVELPYDTDLTNLTPTDISYSAESINPTIMDALNFNIPQVYTLATSGMLNVSYTVNVVKAKDSTAKINEYVYSGYVGVIDEDVGTITINVPIGTDTTNMIPSILNYTGKKIMPNKITGLTVTDDELTTDSYIVEAQNGDVKGYNVIANYIDNGTAKITRFVLGGSEGTIDEVNKKITVVVSKSVNLIDIAPDKIEFEGKSIYPNSTLEQDFTQPVTYTVVAQNNDEVTYTIDVVRLNNEAIITEFAIKGYDGIIDQANKTITVEIPYGIDVTDTIPSKIKYSDKAILIPTEEVSRDFTTEQSYMVESEDGSVVNDYIVKCVLLNDYDNKIIRYVLDGVEGTITNIGNNLGTIDIAIKERVNAPNYSDIAPDLIQITEGAIINPTSVVKMDFVNNKPEYIVKGNYNGERRYVVNLTIIPMDTTAIITNFKIGDIEGIIDEAAKTIDVKLPSDTDIDVTKVIPEIVWQGASINPSENIVVDFTNPVKYTVTAENPNIKNEYIVTVRKLEDLSDEYIITKYVAGGIKGKINQENGEIVLDIPLSRKAEFLNVIPQEIVWKGKTLAPTENHAVNIIKGVKYTVSSESGKIKEYNVIANVYDDIPINDECIITRYVIGGIEGRINQSNGIITVRIPASKQNNYKNIAPDIIEWSGKTLTPIEDAKINVIKGQTYVVTSELGRTKTYKVKANVYDDSDKPIVEKYNITEYRMLDIDAEVSQDSLTILLRIPESRVNEFNKEIVPSKVTWNGSKLNPNELVKVNIFDNPTYTVYNSEGKGKTYEVKTEIIKNNLSSDCLITRYVVNGYEGEINQDTRQIVIDVPMQEKGDYKNVAPDVVEWVGSVLLPNEYTVVDLENGATYRVYAENTLIWKDYDVIINFVEDDTPPDDTDEPSDEEDPPIDTDEPPTDEENPPDDELSNIAEILEYKVFGVNAEINQDLNVIQLVLPIEHKSFATFAIPDLIVWNGYSLAPTEVDSVNLLNKCEYIVTAENGDMRVYEVDVEWINDEDVDNPNTGVADETVRVFLWLLIASGFIVGFGFKRKEK